MKNGTNTVAWVTGLFAITLFSYCSTQKNTAVSRGYHNLTSRFNIYFNGNESFKAGLNTINQQIADDYTQILPFYKYQYPTAAKAAVSDMDFTIQKSLKVIKNHSITAKPKTPDRKTGLSQKEKEFYNKTEFCKWVDDSYLLMGKANYISSDYPRAINAFRLIITRYKNENTRFEAMLWLTKVYIAQQQYNDALAQLTELEEDKRHDKQLNTEIYITYANIYVATKKYDKAIPYLEKAIENIRNKDKKARYLFILAQINQQTGNTAKAAEIYQQLIKKNPPYVLSFNAKINLATVLSSESDNAGKLKKELQKLLYDDKNTEYRDQIYFAMAQLSLREKNMSEAILNYKKSAQYSVSNSAQKAQSFMALANIYYNQRSFINAAAYYDSCLQYLPPNYSEYTEISEKAITLRALVTNLNQASLQDSLQILAQMSESERNSSIAQIIAQVIEDEAKGVTTNTNNNDPYGFEGRVFEGGDPKFSGKWYMYNPTALSYGRSEFVKKWGERPLEDNWRRKNKMIVNQFNDNNNNTNTADIINPNDKKKPEFYLKNIPLTDSAFKQSVEKKATATINAAEIYFYKLNEPNQAVTLLENLNATNKEHLYLLDSYYLLYKLHVDVKNTDRADYYKELIVLQFPDSKYARLLSDPTYLTQVKQRNQKAEDLYMQCYNSYKSVNYSEALILAKQAEMEYTDTDIYPSFLYISALSYGGLQDITSMKNTLNLLVIKYPNAKIITKAKETLDLLNSGKYDYSVFKNNFDGNHYFLIVYKKSAPNTQTLSFNLTAFSAGYSNQKNYAIEETAFSPEYNMLKTGLFSNKTEAVQFFSATQTANLLKGINASDVFVFAISDENLQTLLTNKQLQAYISYYKFNYN